MRDATLEPGEKAKRTETLLIPCGKYDALFVRVELVSKPTSKKYFVVDDPLSEKWSVYWHFLDEMKPIYFIKERENWERERNCLIYKNTKDSCCKKILEEFDGADKKYLEKHIVMSDEEIKVAMDRTDRISKRHDVRRYLMTYTKTLPQSSAMNCK